ncbi:MAG TPA: inositol monophosphatase [Candidatus Scatomonas pullistercoris]|uniref:Inositol-1-monophosphatase n=1 Tax=Candidatus Scatomonas pullistercoris TaxID=2840920 RepID=A0A9D1TAE5_9FIRM|nr:inositol monophosphatase [Candidatus Scatomonas pullistercoris]
MNQKVLPEFSMDQIIEIVRGTRKIIMDAEARAHVHRKGPADFVTDVDFHVQEYLSGELARLYPEIQFMGEEKDNRELDLDGALWILDPVDGTTNLIHQYRQSAVSLALCAGRQVVAGIIYNPYSEEVFSARKGEGAFCCGQPMQVSRAETLAESLVEFGTSPYYREYADWTFHTAEKIFLHCQDIRRTGSAALDIAYVAAGRSEAFYEKRLSPWDYAAGLLLVQEAGGRVTDFGGKLQDPTRPSEVLATNGKVHGEMLRLLSENSRE